MVARDGPTFLSRCVEKMESIMIYPFFEDVQTWYGEGVELFAVCTL